MRQPSWRDFLRPRESEAREGVPLKKLRPESRTALVVNLPPLLPRPSPLTQEKSAELPSGSTEARGVGNVGGQHISRVLQTTTPATNRQVSEQESRQLCSFLFQRSVVSGEFAGVSYGR